MSARGITNGTFLAERVDDGFEDLPRLRVLLIGVLLRDDLLAGFLAALVLRSAGLAVVALPVTLLLVAFFLSATFVAGVAVGFFFGWGLLGALVAIGVRFGG